MFCHHCGQKDAPKRLTTHALIHQFFGDYFTFDSKFFRSIIPLLIKPGYLTNQYFEGKRAHFIPALRMYIFISFLYFIIMPNSLALRFTSENGQNFGLALFEDEKRTEVEWSDSLTIFEQMELMSSDSVKSTIVVFNDTIRGSADEQVSNSMEPDEEDGYFTRLVKKRVKNADTMSAALFMNTLNNNFGSALPKTLFVMIPLIAFLLKLLYVRHNKFFYPDHLVFVLHLHSFYFLLLFIVGLLMLFNLSTLTSLVLVGGGFLYLWFAIRKVYRQKFFKSFFKIAILSFFYMVFFILGIVLNLMIAFYYI